MVLPSHAHSDVMFKMSMSSKVTGHQKRLSAANDGRQSQWMTALEFSALH